MGVEKISKYLIADSLDYKVVKKLRDSIFESAKIVQNAKSADVKKEKVLREVEDMIDNIKRKLFEIQ